MSREEEAGDYEEHKETDTDNQEDETPREETTDNEERETPQKQSPTLKVTNNNNRRGNKRGQKGRASESSNAVVENFEIMSPAPQKLQGRRR